MHYVYTSAYISRGGISSDRDKIVIDDQARQLRVTLTDVPDVYLRELDRALVLSTMMLQGKLAPSKFTVGDVESRIASSASKRKKRFGRGPYLVVEARGDIDNFQLRASVEHDELIVGFDGFDKATITEARSHEVSSAIGSVLATVPGIVSLEKVKSGVSFRRDDGKPVYSFSIEMMVPTVSTTRAARREDISTIGRAYEMLIRHPEVSSVCRLLRSSYENHGDRLRAFLAAWWALETLVNTQGRGQGTTLSQRMNPFFERLSPSTSEADVAAALSVKRVRDALLHGREFADKELPVEKLQELVSKYLSIVALDLPSSGGGLIFGL